MEQMQQIRSECEAASDCVCVCVLLLLQQQQQLLPPLPSAPPHCRIEQSINLEN